MKRICLIIVVALMGSHLTGCISEPNASRFARAANKSLQEVSKAILAAAKAQAGANKEQIEAYEAEHQERVAEMNKRVDEMVKKAEADSKLFKDFAHGIAQLAGSTFPGGSVVASIIGSMSKMKQTASDETAKEVSGLKTNLEVKINDVAASQKTLDDLTEIIKGMNENEQDKLRTRILAEVALTSDVDQAKFEKAFKEELLKAAKDMDLTPEDIEKMTSMTPGEVYAAYGTGGAGGLVALMALLRTFGTSRGKEELDRLREEIMSDRLAAAATTSTSTPTTPRRRKKAT